LRHPEPDAHQDRLPLLEFYLAVVALHHRDRAIRGVGMAWARRDASPQTPRGTPRTPTGLTVRTLARHLRRRINSTPQAGGAGAAAPPGGRDARAGGALAPGHPPPANDAVDARPGAADASPRRQVGCVPRPHSMGEMAGHGALAQIAPAYRTVDSS